LPASDARASTDREPGPDSDDNNDPR
jgi:hypothetical protein